MEFRSIVPIIKNENQINYNSKIVSFGSCFAENIAAKFDFYKFENLCNPFGIIFNVVSLEKIITRVVNLDYYSEKDIFQNNGLWHCYEIHSSLSTANKKELIDLLNTKLFECHSYLLRTTTLIITAGTSWVYQLNESQEIVANCHKMPQNLFSKILLTTENNISSLKNIISKIHEIKPDINFTFTISPVRHLKDGFFENNVSKSNLFSAIYEIVSCKLGTYFPSYEIVVDELRDYRFYTSDLLHPTDLAIDYIWEQFKETQLSADSYLITDAVDSIQKMLRHRPKNATSGEYDVFKRKLEIKIAQLNSTHPQIKF